MFEFEETSLKGAFLIKTFTAGDIRGRFTKYFEQEFYANAGIIFTLSESFASISSKGVLRGLHFQLKEPQAKLVTVITGKVYDVIVDLRTGSKTFGKWVGYELSADNALALYIPRGFAHGFLTLEDNSIMLYQCDGKYDAETDTGIRFDDPNIGIDWMKYTNVFDNLIVSKRDSELFTYSELKKYIVS